MTVRSSFAAAAAAGLLAVAVSACGNGDPNQSNSAAGGGGGGNSAVQAVTSGTAAKTVGETDQQKFDPPSIQVKVNDVVEWDNPSALPHNVTFEAGTKSDTMTNGAKFLAKFTTAGSYKYQCTFHPGMNGVVVVG